MGECHKICPRCGDKLYQMVGFTDVFRCYRCARYWRETNGELEFDPHCPRCGTVQTEGNFRAACKVCNPFQFEPCGLKEVLCT
jgi:hypothetical protein